MDPTKDIYLELKTCCSLVMNRRSEYPFVVGKDREIALPALEQSPIFDGEIRFPKILDEFLC